MKKTNALPPVRLVLTAFFLMLSVSAVNCEAKKNTDQADSAKAAATDYANPDLLVLDPDLKDKDLIIVDARRPGEYKAGHIPGAVNLWWKDFGDPDLLSVSKLSERIGNKGISTGSRILVYDSGRISRGEAGRIFWMLEYLGCQNVKVLNGGWAKWVADKKPVDQKAVTLSAASFLAEPKPSKLAQKNDIAKKLDRKKFIIIDARSDEEFNGWALNGEARGGHIKNAVSMPHKWFFNGDGTVRDAGQLKAVLESHGVTFDRDVAVYASHGVRSAAVYFVLRLMGYPQCANYDGSLLEWAKDETLSVDALPRYEKLVNAAWVDELIKGGNPGKAGQPDTYPGKGYVIVHASSLYWKKAADPNGYNPHGDYDSGHIPGAVSIPLHVFDVQDEHGIYPWTRPQDGNILRDDQLKEIIESYGITHDKTVVVYCGNKSYVGGAYRVAWVLMYAGVEDVRYLNGDLAAWVENGGKLETTFNKPVPADDFGVDIPVHPQYWVDSKRVESMCGDKSSVIADDRSWTEFAAKDQSGCYYDFFCAPGHVPDAVWVRDMYWYLDDFDTWQKPGYYKPCSLKSYTIIQQEWEKRGVTRDKHIVFYCGGGWRSSLVWFYAYLMGYPNIANYDGGWYEWTWDPERPVELGE